jgi:formimidoylglutamate deiminase
VAPFARVPAGVNAHSHAFQHDLRGVAERLSPEGRDAGDFWTWRQAMYALADSLDPERMREVAVRCYRAMRAAGYRAVGEFHYVHHRPDGRPYEEPNAMALALADAAEEAGIRLVLLPAAYARAGWDGADLAPTPRQRRFCDPDTGAFIARVDELRRSLAGRPGVSVGVAAHSPRAVPASWLREIARYAAEAGIVRHVHAAEQPRELDEVRAEHGCTPIELLAETGFLGPTTSVVHAIHVSDRDVELLAESGSIVVTCPTTEGNLGDGWFPALRHATAGVRIAVGSDQNLRLDPFEEARELESGARREGLTRHALVARHGGDLWGALHDAGRASLGLDEELPEIEVDRGHADLAGVRDEDLGAALVTSASAAVVVRQP